MRWTKYYDITSSPLWKNDKIIRVYTWLTLHQVGDTGTVTSLRRLAASTWCTLGAVRNALRQLVRYNFIEVVSLVPLCIKPVDPGNAGRRILSFDPKKVLEENIGTITEVLVASRQSVEHNIAQFLNVQALTARRWDNEGELIRHFVNWFLKNDHRQHQQRLESQSIPPVEEVQQAAPIDEFERKCRKYIQAARRGDKDARHFLTLPEWKEEYTKRGWQIDEQSWTIFVPNLVKK